MANGSTTFPTLRWAVGGEGTLLQFEIGKEDIAKLAELLRSNQDCEVFYLTLHAKRHLGEAECSELLEHAGEALERDYTN